MSTTDLADLPLSKDDEPTCKEPLGVLDSIEKNNNSDTDYSDNLTCEERESDENSGSNNESIENRSASLPDVSVSNSFRRRSVRSENDVSLKSTLSTFKSQIEDVLHKKLCKECLVRSLQSKLSVLGIVAPSDVDVLEVKTDGKQENTCEETHENTELLKQSDDDDSLNTEYSQESAGKRLLRSLHKRTVSNLIEIYATFLSI